MRVPFYSMHCFQLHSSDNLLEGKGFYTGQRRRISCSSPAPPATPHCMSNPNFHAVIGYQNLFIFRCYAHFIIRCAAIM